MSLLFIILSGRSCKIRKNQFSLVSERYDCLHAKCNIFYFYIYIYCYIPLGSQQNKLPYVANHYKS